MTCIHLGGRGQSLVELTLGYRVRRLVIATGMAPTEEEGKEYEEDQDSPQHDEPRDPCLTEVSRGDGEFDTPHPKDIEGQCGQEKQRDDPAKYVLHKSDL